MEDHLSIARSPLQRYEQLQEQQQQGPGYRRSLTRTSPSECLSKPLSSSTGCIYRSRSCTGRSDRRREPLYSEIQSPSAAAAAAADTTAEGDSLALSMLPPAATFPRSKLSSRGLEALPEGISGFISRDLPLGGSSFSAGSSSLQQPLLRSSPCLSSDFRVSPLPPPAQLTGPHVPVSGIRGKLLQCAKWMLRGDRTDPHASRLPTPERSTWGPLGLTTLQGHTPSESLVERVNSSSVPTKTFCGRGNDEPPVERLSSLSCIASLAQRPRKFVVADISGGCCHRREVQTPELLRMVHLHNKKRELLDMKVGALKLRDLRQVVSPSGDGRPSIEVRRNCVLVNMPTIRCILMHQRVLLLPPNQALSHFGALTPRPPRATLSFHLSDTGGLEDEGPGVVDLVDQQYEMLVSKLVHLSEFKRSGPPEFAALEALLVHVCDSLITELAPLKAAADKLLQYFHEQPSSTRRLRQISELKRRLGNSKEKAHGVERAIRELLSEEEDVLRLELGKFWGHDELWDKPPKTGDAEDAEILLECYEQEVEAIYQVIVRTEDALDDALQLMELHLASTRNAFLKTEIALDIVSAFFGFVAAAAGVFGMNIRSGWEDKETIFWGIFAACSVASLAMLAAVYFWFRTQKL